MALAKAKLTAQGQISLPAEVRKRIGVRPGSTVEFVEEGGQVVVRRAGKYTFEDMHKALFKEPPPKKSAQELKEGIAEYIRQKHAGRRY